MDVLMEITLNKYYDFTSIEGFNFHIDETDLFKLN